jgi:beta-carotene 3-hydroxylase
MTTFGVAYFVVHDGFIHGRLPVAFLARSAYLRRVRNAHRVHHMRSHDAPYGLFLGEAELRFRRRRARRAAQEALTE